MDDANVNDVGAGHVETWYGRQANASSSWNVAPAYGLAQGIEIAAALSHDRASQVNTSSVQAKFRLTEPIENGCNFADVMGLGHASADDRNTPYLNGILSCNVSGGAVHFNLGGIYPSGSASLRTWGLAYEREFGAVTGHVEYFGQQQNSPTAQLGLRREVAKNIQLDGTIGRGGSETVYSLGMKFMF